MAKKINRYKNGEPHGKWITYADSTLSVILTQGRFKNGIPVGKWVYYSENGAKNRVERYHGSKMKIKHFHPNGHLALSGKAVVLNNDKDLHFYYTREWKFYKESGELEKTAWYEKGKMTREEFAFRRPTNKYDSLIAELRALDLDYVKYRDTLLNTERRSGKASAEYNYVRKLYRDNDSLVLDRIDKIITRYGYPAKEHVGESNGVIFYIISSAKWEVKEKYLATFEAASAKGEISKKDMAYFNDKLMAGKEGWQIYGTQFRFSDNKMHYYPVRELSGMNERRLKVGLEVVNLLDYSEKN